MKKGPQDNSLMNRFGSLIETTLVGGASIAITAYTNPGQGYFPFVKDTLSYVGGYFATKALYSVATEIGQCCNNKAKPN